MATRKESLARVGAAVQMGGMVAQMMDPNSSGWDDRAGRIAQKVGEGFVRASVGNTKGGAGLLREAATALNALADEMEAGKEAEK